MDHNPKRKSIKREPEQAD